MSKRTSIAEAAATVVGGGKTGGSHSANPAATGVAGLPNSNMGSGDKTANKSATPDGSGLGATETPNESNVKPITSGDNKATLKPGSRMKEDVEAIFSGAELSEEIKEKATVVYEAAVNAKVQEKVLELEEEFDAQLEEAVKSAVEDLVENVDSYLNYVAEKWLENNVASVENQIKLDLSESFIKGLKQLFEDHYVDIPDDKVDVVSELASEIERLKAQLNEETESNINLKKQMTEAEIKSIVSEETAELPDTHKEKIIKLAEGVSYSSVEDFKEKLKIIKENYTNSPKTGDSEKLNTDSVVLNEEKSQVKIADPLIAHFAQHLGRSVKK